MFSPDPDTLAKAKELIDGLVEGRQVHAIGVGGSFAYGLAHEKSDLDVRFIYSSHPEEFVWRQTPKSTLSSLTADIDIVGWELSHFCRMAFSCNPNPLEFLWLDHHEALDAAGYELIDMRRNFLSVSEIKRSFGGFALGQIERARRLGGINDQKLYLHGFRVMMCASELLVSGDLPVRLDDEAKATLGNVLALDVTRRLKVFEQMTASFRTVSSDVIPVTAEPDAIITFLKDHRRRQLA